MQQSNMSSYPFNINQVNIQYNQRTSLNLLVVATINLINYKFSAITLQGWKMHLFLLMKLAVKEENSIWFKS